MSSEDFSLKWNDHHTVFFSAAERLCRSDLLTDVTIVCGNKELAAHKLVLSASSGYFANLFKPRTKMTSSLGTVPVHSVIYLRDIHSSYMESILDYMYRGEILVQEDDLLAVLAAAKVLQVKGLTDANTDEIPRIRTIKAAPSKAQKRPLEEDEMDEDPEAKKVKDETMLAVVTEGEVDAESLNDPLPPRSQQQDLGQETVFGTGDDDDEEEGIVEEYGGEEMTDMGEASTVSGHFDDDFDDDDDQLGATLVSLSGTECPECMKSFSSKNCMKRHYNNVHVKEKPFTCWNCDYKASRRTSLRDHCLRQHKMSKEEFAQKANDTYKKITLPKEDLD